MSFVKIDKYFWKNNLNSDFLTQDFSHQIFALQPKPKDTRSEHSKNSFLFLFLFHDFNFCWHSIKISSFIFLNRVKKEHPLKGDSDKDSIVFNNNSRYYQNQTLDVKFMENQKFICKTIQF